MQIQRSFKGEKKTGVLYLVPTPIGNREGYELPHGPDLKGCGLDRS